MREDEKDWRFIYRRIILDTECEAVIHGRKKSF